jgi:glycosyltransferase involved in cell wall biosynthesis
LISRELEPILPPGKRRIMKTKKHPLVTIVTPSYNQADYLERTILSVLNQDYPNIEYIVIDGGSTDGSIDIIKKYEDRLSYWISEPDTGQSNAINKGFKNATGEIFNWLNSDDLLMPSATTIAVHYLTNHSEYGMVYGDRLVVDENDQVLACVELPSFRPSLLRFGRFLPQETSFFRRDLWRRANGLDEDLHISMDRDLWLKFIKIGKLYHIPFILGSWRQHASAKSYLAFGPQHVSGKGCREKVRVEAAHLSRVYRSKALRRVANKVDKLRTVVDIHSKRRKRERAAIYDLISRTNGDSSKGESR